MRRISQGIRNEVVRLWMEGHTYRSIGERLGVSLGAISSIVEEARKRRPDMDELRGLYLRLKKLGCPLPDAARGVKLLERLNELGVSLGELGLFIEAAKRTSSEEFLASAMKLIKIEKETGKRYDEIMKGLKDKVSKLRELEAEADRLKGELERLKSERARLKGELEAIKDGLRRAIETKRRLRSLGLDELEALAEFAEDRRRMEEELKGLKDEVDRLRRLNNQLERENEGLAKENQSLGLLKAMLEARLVTVPCRFCGCGVYVKLEGRKSYDYMLRSGFGVRAWCPRCGYENLFDPRDVLINFAWRLLPS